MTGWEALEIARKGNKKFKRSNWADSYFYHFKENAFLADCRDNPINTVDAEGLSHDDWEIVKEKAKMITWYQPSLTWLERDNHPRNNDGEPFFKTKEEAINAYDGHKILKWQEIEAPETWGQCD